MASKASVTFNILLVSLAVILANIIRSKVVPIDNEVKHSIVHQRDSVLNFTQLSGRYGFSSEEHTVTTEDGYILTIFRIRKRECKQYRRPPAILQHGLLQSADAWLDAGPDAGLAYLIADACYDLWVGNQRGNYYARRHVRLDPDKDAKFWQFSVDEIGFYDIPATIDYVLKHTGEQKLNYIGYSQGAGTYFIMCSERPGYCNKANVLIGLAPAARQTHTKSVSYRLYCETVKKFERELTAVGVTEVFAKGAITQDLLAFMCQFSVASGACGLVDGLVDSFHPGSISSETLKVMYGHFPAGTSLQNMARYGQSMTTDRFQKYDYGKSRNLDLYGDERPPLFNLSAVTVPFVALYGRNDYLVDPKDLYWLVNNLPNVLEVKEVKDPLWNHFDDAYSQFTKQMILPKVIQYLNKYSKLKAMN